MFDLGWPEMLVIAVVLIVVVGPKDLPRMLRTFGRTTTKLRSMAGDFRKQFDDALKEAELDGVKDLVDGARSLDPRNEIKKHLSPLEKAGRDIRSGLDAAMKPQTVEKSAASDSGKAAQVAKPQAKPAKPAKKTTKGRTKSAASAARARKSTVAKTGTGAAAETATKPRTRKARAAGKTSGVAK